MVTDLAVHRFDASGRMAVDSLHPGVTREQVLGSMGWEPQWADTLHVTEPPSVEELRLIREELDPRGVYTG